jgi:transketolase
VSLALSAKKALDGKGIPARVVSMPSWELFREQPTSYRNQVLPPAVKARLAVEAGSPQGWREYVGDQGDIIGINEFGASAPGSVVMERYGFTVDNIVTRALALLR